MQTAIDKIRELRALHEDGLLSRQEFDLRKNAILDAAYTPAERTAAQGPGTELGPTPEPIRPGTEIGLMAGQEIGPQTRRYRLERLIAHGGMGQVWQATDLATHAELGHSAQVALKILPPHLTQAASHAKLLIQEATRARRLAHEHIVRVYEWAQDPATASFFLIMEYLEGEDLDAVLAREQRLPLDRVLALLDPVADALDYAWDKHRLVHRDIKPGNVFVTRRGEVKLLDFGIAARARASGGMSPLDAPATSGTAGYRAPEASSEGVVPEPTLDVYAVAVMIHQLLTGVLPGEPGGTVPETLGARQWEALRGAFGRDPARRPATVHALLDAIRAAAGPSAEELAAQESLRRAEQEKEARELAARRKQEADAAAVVQARLDEQRRIQLREQQRRERAAAEEARLARKELLRQQLLAKRDEEVAKTQAAKEEAARKAAQARAAAAYLAQQKKAREEELAAQAARAAEPSAPAPAAVAPAPPALDAGGTLHDPFIDGSGSGPALVPIQAGRFEMGSPDHERRIAMAAGSQKNWIARETPQHWVGIERPFAMGRHPVTVGEWRVFVQASGWQQHGEVNWESPGFPQDDTHPVVGISWFDALQYVAWLSAATGKRYRLPSEAEWEYACRAGSKTAFNVGDTISTTQANFDGSFTYNGGPRGDFRHGTTPAGFFPPNAWGLHDMHGNVWEWVQDVVHDNYEGAPLDGSAWETGGDQVRRILRGGSWLYNPRYLRSALRNGFSAVLSNDIVGFRVVREL
ncbi:bifunctional serine/threonine-protein kinase/formylglycine-generating enzyme family protein [Telluria beijingensis]|uniref:bifunctional serine/threonine-protein kinase/formylglycine-generating enzyme family protein n=1 Tax=Telluria beijingensis TaxID=3068633 RepID=UPI002795A957|nr:bifunctional serine/threonine-protein kinase/formylglycine-generating enzyme family protein [Massilia sp. REN29]